MSATIPVEVSGSGGNVDVSTPATPGVREPGRSRIDSIDLLRGIVMVIMMLDHTRDYVHYGALLFDPLDLSKTTTAPGFRRFTSSRFFRHLWSGAAVLLLCRWLCS